MALDYGGVLADHHIRAAEDRLAGLFSVDVATLSLMLSERSALGRLVRRGDLSVLDFWSSQAKRCGLTRLPAAVEDLSRMWAETYRLNQDFAQGLKAIRSRARIGIVSNIDEGRASYLVERVGIMDLVDFFWASHTLRLTKAEPKMWAQILEEARENGITKAMYVDDRPQHVKSACAAGFTGFIHTGSVRTTLDAIAQWVDEN